MRVQYDSVYEGVPSYLLFILDALTYPYDRVNIHPQFVFYLTVHESTGKKMTRSNILPSKVKIR